MINLKKNILPVLKFIAASLIIFFIIGSVSYAISGLSWPANNGNLVSEDLINELRTWAVIGATFVNAKDAVNNNIYHLGRVGIGTNNPNAMLDIAGIVKPGYAAACNGDSEGAIRYNNINKVLEGCDGVEWMSFSEIMPTNLMANLNYNSSAKTRGNCLDMGGEIAAVTGDPLGTEVCRFTAVGQTNAICPAGWSKASNWTTTEGCADQDISGNPTRYFMGPKTVYCNVPDGEQSDFCPNTGCSDPHGTGGFNLPGHSWSNQSPGGYTATDWSDGENGNAHFRWDGFEYERLEGCGPGPVGTEFELVEGSNKYCGYTPKSTSSYLGQALGYIHVVERTVKIGCY